MTHLAPYRPISCDFHDVLEATATRRASATIDSLTLAGPQAHAYARIADIATRRGGEYLILASGEAIRLDRVVSVDGVRRGDFHD